MTRIPFFLVDSFTNTPFRGNPAGVVLLDSPEVSTGTGGRLAGPIAEQMLNQALSNG